MQKNKSYMVQRYRGQVLLYPEPCPLHPFFSKIVEDIHALRPVFFVCNQLFIPQII